MVQSMTAFARIEKELETGQISWEIRSINHRYLDINFYLPEPFRFLEAAFRKSIRNTISRGKIDCHLKYLETDSNHSSMLLNMGMINALLDVTDRLTKTHHLPNDLSLSHVLSWPGVVQKTHMDIENLSLEVTDLFNDSINKLIETKKVEGSALKVIITNRLNSLKEEVSRLQSLAPTQVLKTKEKLHGRLKSLQSELSDERMSQEIALLLTKMDVSEELDRLDIHIAEVARILNNDSIMGRRLDFLMQELNREANTLSSKSDTIEFSQSVVEMKVLIEQMREQVQNIE